MSLPAPHDPGRSSALPFDFSQLFQAESAMFSVAGADGFFRDVNPAFQALLGRSKKELLERSLFEFVYPADIPETLRGLSALTDRREDAVFETRWVHGNGSVRWLAWVARSANDGQLWYATARDVTESRTLQESLRETQDRLNLALSVAGAGSWDWNIKKRSVLVDSGTETLLGSPAGAFDGSLNQVLRFIHPKDRRRILELRKTALESAGSFEADFRLRDETTGTRHLSLRGQIVARDRRARPVRALGIVFDTTSQKALEEQLLSLVMHDPLTGIRNRRSFDHSLQHEWRRAMRSRSSLALLMIDIDEFKLFNDEFGHQGGDRALCAVARALGAGLKRPADVLARYGGEEFVALLPETTLEQAENVGARLLEGVRDLKIAHARSRHGAVTVSLGCAAMLPGGDARLADLISAADSALYLAKDRGRNCLASLPAKTA